MELHPLRSKEISETLNKICETLVKSNIFENLKTKRL